MTRQVRAQAVGYATLRANDSETTLDVLAVAFVPELDHGDHAMLPALSDSGDVVTTDVEWLHRGHYVVHHVEFREPHQHLSFSLSFDCRRPDMTKFIAAAVADGMYAVSLEPYLDSALSENSFVLLTGSGPTEMVP